MLSVVAMLPLHFWQKTTGNPVDSRGLRVILAGVSEHPGDDFPAFGDSGESFLSSEVFEAEFVGVQSESGKECGVEVFDGLR